MIILFLLLVSIMNTYCGTKYIYPIGTVPNSLEKKIVIIHQNNNTHRQVFLWDSGARTYELGLSSQYNPIGVQLLRNGTGFSFIDNGIVKIKFFNKRSVKIIEIYEPLYNIANVTWISDEYFIFQAQRGNRYGIYQSDLEGNVSIMQADVHCDYRYPTLIDTKLFYISKDVENTYSIAYTAFPNNTTYSIYTSIYPLMHLTMFSPEEGYILEKRERELVICYFYGEGSVWRFEDIFYFKEKEWLFLDNNETLCEILRPFLPHKAQNRIFLPVDVRNESGYILYYDVKKRRLLRHKYPSFFLPPTINPSATVSFFGCPLIVNDAFLVGIGIED